MDQKELSGSKEAHFTKSKINDPAYIASAAMLLAVNYNDAKVQLLVVLGAKIAEVNCYSGWWMNCLLFLDIQLVLKSNQISVSYKLV